MTILTNNTNDNRIRVWVTKDLEIDLNFLDKEIDIISNTWTVKVLKSVVETAVSERLKQEQEIQKEEDKIIKEYGGGAEGEPKQGGQQIQLPAKDARLQQIIQIFEVLARGSAFNDVSLTNFRQELIKKGLIRNKEFNALLNETLTKDILEESSDRVGFYRLKKKNV